MADQSKIDASSVKITGLIDKARAEMVQNLYDIGTEIDDIDLFIKAMLDLDIKGTLRGKVINATNFYTQAHREVLESTIQFASVKESTLMGFIELNQGIFDDTITNTIAQHIRNEVVKGVQSGLSANQIVNSVINSSISNAQMETVVTTTLNDYSRTITNNMMKEAPANTKYIYIGPIDGRTREICLGFASKGEITLEQIKKLRGCEESLSYGGGFNCRHKWEIASEERLQDA